jgi:hypothetical protein
MQLDFSLEKPPSIQNASFDPVIKIHYIEKERIHQSFLLPPPENGRKILAFR